MPSPYDNVLSIDALAELSPMARAALELAAFGFFVFPLYEVLPDLTCSCGSVCGSPGKHPRIKSGLKEATTDLTTVRRWWRKWQNAAIGLNAEKSGLLILDLDPRNGGNESLADIEVIHGELPPTYEVATGGGGKHFYFRADPVKSNPIAPGLDIKSRGGYVVAPPSGHVSGRAYVAAHLGDPRGFIVEPPEWLLDLCTKPKTAAIINQATHKPVAKAADVTRGLFGCAFMHAGWLGPYAAPGKCTARCPFDGEHTSGPKNEPTSSTVVFAPETGISGFVHCSHSHCANRTQSEFWNALPNASRLHAQAVLKTSPLYSPEPDGWQRTLKFDKRGGLQRLAINGGLVLKNHPDLRGCLGYDTFAYKPVWLKSPPVLEGLDPVAVGQVCDQDLSTIAFFLATKCDMQEPSAELAKASMLQAAVRFHPVRDYLHSIVWDERPRVFKWLHTHLGAADTRYNQLVGSWWMVSAIARIMQPGAKADHVLILEGLQGSRKSTALRKMAVRDGWFADTPLDIGSKDSYIQLQGKWIYEMQEMHSFTRADVEAAKSFFSTTSDNFRAPYGHIAEDHPRQCVFAGTTNQKLYLKDDSGNRRYWPVETGYIQAEQIEVDRDQLWAEALHLYKLGYQWEPISDEEKTLCQAEQAKRITMDEDPWLTPVRLCVAGKDDVSAYEILDNPVHFPGNKKGHGDAIRVAKCLSTLGWIRTPTRTGIRWTAPK